MKVQILALFVASLAAAAPGKWYHTTFNKDVTNMY